MAAIWQNTPSISLENGFYDGLSTVAELRRHGNQGIGAFDQLDGEMVGVDGTFYRVTEDSVAHVPGDQETLPFCMVTNFGATTESHELPQDMSKERLFEWVDGVLGTRNLFYSLRIDGTFRTVQSRCLPRQERPFPLLKDVEKTQAEYSYEEIEATMVGFRAPAYVGRTSPPEYHLHFISADRTFGGHVISFVGCHATLTVERVEKQEILYPTSPEFAEKDLV